MCSWKPKKTPDPTNIRHKWRGGSTVDLRPAAINPPPTSPPPTPPPSPPSPPPPPPPPPSPSLRAATKRPARDSERGQVKSSFSTLLLLPFQQIVDGRWAGGEAETYVSARNLVENFAEHEAYDQREDQRFPEGSCHRVPFPSRSVEESDDSRFTTNQCSNALCGPSLCSKFYFHFHLRP
jgi:hypothetical protein